MEKFLNKWEILITIIISITSIFLAIKANEMTKIQTEVARNSSLPNIQVVEKNLINEKTGKTDDSIIQISNLNGRLNNYESRIATVYKGNIIKNLIMDCQSYTKYRPNETTGGIFVSWRRKEELPTGA